MFTPSENPSPAAGTAPGTPLPSDCLHLRELHPPLERSFSDALRLFFLLMLVLVASGELQFHQLSDTTGRGLRVFSPSDTLPLWILGILCWDVVMIALTRWFRPATTIDEPLLSLGLVLPLWRLVLANLWLCLFPDSGTSLPAPASWAATLLVFSILIISKEQIARELFAHNRGSGSPLLAVWAWHHRKDAVFSLVFLAIWLLEVLFGLPLRELTIAGAAVRLLLLGSAALEITRFSIHRIRSSRQEERFDISSPSETGI